MNWNEILLIGNTGVIIVLVIICHILNKSNVVLLEMINLTSEISLTAKGRSVENSIDIKKINKESGQ